MMADDYAYLLVLVGVLGWAVVKLARKVEDLQEDIDLLADGDTELVKAKRELAYGPALRRMQRVARETEKR